jgi:serine/threonine protein kinase
MPPEVMVANPKYDTSVDEFSYGIMMIHMFSGQWPEPQVGPSQIEGGKLIPVTEAERREKFFEAIEDGHPLMDLIHRCINNDPQLRPHAGEISMRVSQVATQFPASFANRLELLRQIEEKDLVIHQNEVRIMMLQQEAKQKADEIDRLNMVYSSEVEQLKLEVRDLNSQNELLVARHKAEVTEHKVSNSMRENTEKLLQQEKELSGTLAESLQEKDAVISGMKEQLTKMREYLTANKQQVS